MTNNVFQWLEQYLWMTAGARVHIVDHRQRPMHLPHSKLECLGELIVRLHYGHCVWMRTGITLIVNVHIMASISHLIQIADIFQWAAPPSGWSPLTSRPAAVMGTLSVIWCLVQQLTLAVLPPCFDIRSSMCQLSL